MPFPSVERPLLKKATVLATGTLTVLAGAIIAPSLPEIARFFRDTPQAELLSRLVMTLPALFVALVGPVVGWSLDRFGRKPVLYGSLVLYAAAGSSGLYLDSLVGLLVGRAFLGVAMAGTMTTCLTLAGDYYDGASRRAFMGQLSAFMSFGGVVFLTGGGLLSELSWRGPFAVYLASLAVIPAAMFFLDEPRRRAAAGASPLTEEARPGFGRLGLLYATTFVAIVFFFVIPVQAPFLFQQVFGVGNSTIGFLAAGMALVQTFVSLAYGRIRSRLGFGAIFALAFVMMGLGNLLLGLADRAWIAAVVLVCLGVGHGLLMPNLSYWALSLAPEPARGRVMGGLATFFALGQFVSPLVFHPLIALASLQGAFVICGAALFGLSAGTVMAAWRRRSRTGRPLESGA